MKFCDDVSVTLVKHSAADSDVLWAARVSTAGEQSLDEQAKDPERSKGLINYLMRDRHGSPFEHNSMTFLVSAPIFVFREFQRHRVGWCLAGGTRITLVSPGGDLCHRSVRELYEDFRGGAPDRLPASGGAAGRYPERAHLHHVRCHDERTLVAKRAPVLDAMETGVKRLLRLTTATGKSLRCSEDHAVFTPEGWRKAGELGAGDSVMAADSAPGTGQGPVPPAPRRGIGEGTNLRRARPIGPQDVCHLCSRVFPGRELRLVPVLPVLPIGVDPREALDEGDLAPVCEPCQAARSAEEAAERAPARRGGAVAVARPDVLVSVADDGEEMTYDLSVEGPWHNFLAEGIVVHNSYNEESGRYRELQPVFYVPSDQRELVQRGRPGKYEFVPGSPEQHQTARGAMEESYRRSYQAYQEMLDAGVAREVARAVLPVGLFSSMYATCNARSLMHFLSLRTKDERARVASFPQREIEMVAEKMEAEWARLMPLTHAAFNANGRVAP